MKNLCRYIGAAMGVLCSIMAAAQTTTTLNADGPGNTYELINSVLSPGYTAVEPPDCAHTAFGRHMAEVFDATLNKYVFEFYIHVNEDNDRCIAFDRQRVEIKTYDQSPDNLIATVGETVTYKWQFRLPAGFQPSSSFTHIHQVKAVGGDESNPIFTLTPRKGSPNKMELIYVGPDNVTNKVAIVNLSLFAGVWVEATETLTVGANGSYSMVVKRMSDDATLISYSNSNLATIRPTNDFLRPKWGIYRSLNVPADLRDDSIRLGTISISESNVVLPVRLLSFTAARSLSFINLAWTTTDEANSKSFIIERSADGINYLPIGSMPAAGSNAGTKQYGYTDPSPLEGFNYYRLKMLDQNGAYTYSAVQVQIFSGASKMPVLFPNPVKDVFTLSVAGEPGMLRIAITDAQGKNVLTATGSLAQVNQQVTRQLYQVKPGLYFLSVQDQNNFSNIKFLKQ